MILHTRAIWKLELRDPTLKLVMLCLGDHATEENNHAWPGVDTMAVECDLNRSTVQRAVNRLVKLGLLLVVSQGGGRRRATTYLVIPRDDSRSVPVDKGPHSAAVSSPVPTDKGPHSAAVSEKGPHSAAVSDAKGPLSVPERAAQRGPNHQEPEPPRARAREAEAAARPELSRAAGHPTPVGEIIRVPGLFTDERWERLQRKLATPPAGGAPTHDASSESERE